MINELVEVAINAAVEVVGEVVIGTAEVVGKAVVGAVGEAIAHEVNNSQPEPIEAVSGQFGEIFAAVGDREAPTDDREATASDSA